MTARSARPRLGTRALAAVLLLAATSGAAAPEDRLTRFGELARQLAGSPDAPVGEDGGVLLDQLFALADAEIVENLRSGPPFSSPEFIQERLDALMETWGGVRLRVLHLAREGAPSPLTIGVFSVPGPDPRGSVRMYGRREAGDARLLAARDHAGAPDIHAWTPTASGAQFVATWLGGAGGSTGRPLVVEVWRDDGRREPGRLWSSESAFPDGLWASGFGVQNGAISIRYELRSLGWQPGCPEQTEQIDFYRRDLRRGDTLGLAGRRVVNGWHRELHAAMARLLAGLAAGDHAAVAALVPDRALRARLPRALAPDAVCDVAVSNTPLSVVVGATEARSGRMVPWSLSWRRDAGGWRLQAAAPVLE